MRRILVVEDEPSIAFALGADLRTEGYGVTVTSTGDEALRLARDESFDLILLDVMLPGMDGFEVCRSLRRREDRTPIIMLTAKAGEAEKVMGLELGTDDYVTKPFSPRKLRARIKAALRRGGDAEPDTFQFGDVEIDFARCEVRRGGKAVDLSALEWSRLSLLPARVPSSPYRRSMARCDRSAPSAGAGLLRCGCRPTAVISPTAGRSRARLPRRTSSS